MNKYYAEFFGTFTLTLVVALSVVGGFDIPTLVLAGLALGYFVYTIGHISGCHINPAVTLGLLSVNKIKINDALFYILVQVSGAFVASFIVYGFLGNTPLSGATFNYLDLFAETLGMIVFTFGIASVVYGKVSEAMSGIVIGGSLVLGIAVAALVGSIGGLNPAVVLGLQIFDLSYVLGPIMGSVIGFNLFKLLNR